MSGAASTRTPHWLRGNRAGRVPRRVVCLDSEAHREPIGEGERHTLRLACASFDPLDSDGAPTRACEESAFLDSRELWSWVAARTSTRHRTVLFAHHLAYDLRLTRALVELPALGWQLRACALDRYRCWAQWRRDGRSLAMVDTVSIVGRALEAFAEPLGIAKPALPEEDDSLAAWLGRCQSDTRLLRALVLRYLAWLRADDLGDFRLTGPAQASAAFRHRFLKPRTLLVHDDAEALAAERRAAWTGRCEVWRHGEVGEPIFEWDFALAYARTARSALLPVRLRGEVVRPLSTGIAETRIGAARLVECEVETHTPTVPTESGGRIVWPVGRFETTLWDCELRLALAEGAFVTARRAWLYRTAPLLTGWAAWTIERLEENGDGLGAVERAALKQWSRSLIGRFGLRYPSWDDLPDADEPDLALVPFVRSHSGETGAVLRVGRQVMERLGVEDGPDATPCVMSYVMALARVRLWRAMRAVPAGALVYVDTDSLIVTGAGSKALAAFARTPEGEGLRLKGRWPGGVFHAPRVIELGDEARIAGLPKTAVRTGPGEWRGEVWEAPMTALHRRRADTVRVSPRGFRISGQDARRRHLALGGTESVLLSIPERVNGRRAYNASKLSGVK